jgi:hypothetical protein
MATTMATTASNTTTAARIRTISHSMRPERRLSSMGPQVSFFSLFYGPFNCFHSFFRLTLMLSSTKRQARRDDAGRGQEAHALGYRKVCFPTLSLTRHVYADRLSTPHPLGTTTVRHHQHQHPPVDPNDTAPPATPTSSCSQGGLRMRLHYDDRGEGRRCWTPTAVSICSQGGEG